MASGTDRNIKAGFPLMGAGTLVGTVTVPVASVTPATPSIWASIADDPIDPASTFVVNGVTYLRSDYASDELWITAVQTAVTDAGGTLETTMGGATTTSADGDTEMTFTSSGSAVTTQTQFASEGGDVIAAELTLWDIPQILYGSVVSGCVNATTPITPPYFQYPTTMDMMSEKPGIYLAHSGIGDTVAGYEVPHIPGPVQSNAAPMRVTFGDQALSVLSGSAPYSNLCLYNSTTGSVAVQVICWAER